MSAVGGKSGLGALAAAPTGIDPEPTFGPGQPQPIVDRVDWLRSNW